MSRAARRARAARLVVVLAVLVRCGDAPAPRPSRPVWRVETMLFHDEYAEADGYSVGQCSPGLVVVSRNGHEVVRYVGVGSEVVKVAREE